MSHLPSEIVEFNPSAKAVDSAVIWLHGLGANGHDFVPVVPHLGLTQDMAVRFVFPHAPSIPVTINGGYVMPAWYDIFELSISRKIDLKQILASAAKVGDLIECEVAQGVAHERIVLAGFSQGGAVVYQAALSYPKRLAGLVALSTYFATQESIDYSAANQDLPIFIAHGSADPVVPAILGDQAKTLLSQKGYAVDQHSYPIEHSVSPQEIKDIGNWLVHVLGAKT